MTQDQDEALAALGRRVKMHGDGPSMSPLECAHALAHIASTTGIEKDNYSHGGAVQQLEERMARILGKESAVFLPTGTLANHLAVRQWARGKTRVIVQADSHLYNDGGDGASILSGLNLVPIGEGRATFSLEEVKTAVGRSRGGKVPMGLGVISIESPVRRLRGELFERSDVLDICGWARDEGIATHMDGARLFMAAGFTGKTPAEIAAPVDSVYVSMWKYFNAPSGAILAASSEFLEPMRDMRRMFGGGLPAAWPLAAMALDSIDGFDERFATGKRHAEAFFGWLKGHRHLRVEPIAGGSNIFELHVDGVDIKRMRDRLRDSGVELPHPESSWPGFLIKVNETWSRLSTAELTAKWERALAGC